MRLRATLTLLAATAALALGACQRKPAPAPPPPPAAPLTFAQTTPSATVSLTLDRRIQLYPVLHLKLYTDGRRQLLAFARQAEEDRAAEKAGEPAAPYERTLRWRVTADSPQIVSLRQDWRDFTGALHPNHGSTALLWDRRTEAPVAQSALFRPDADFAALDARLCEAVRQAKAARLGPQAAGAGDWSCPTWKSAEAVLAPSTVRGRFGGMTFHFDAYALGAAVAGDYDVTLPQAAFAAALAPAWRPLFAGEPAAVRPGAATKP